MRPLLLSILVVPLLLLAPPARADDAAVAQAKQRFSAAKAAYSEGRYKDAVELFTQANALDPHAELLYNVGQAYEKLGDSANALRVFREYLRLLPNAADRAVVEQKVAKFEESLRARGVQQVTISSSPVGATVVLDDREVGKAPWTGEIPPGHHVAVLKVQGYADGKRDFDLAPDRAMDVDVSLSRPGLAPPDPSVPPGPLAPTPGVTATEPQPPPDTPPRGRHVAPWTFAALGVGVAGLGAALGLEMARRSAESSARGDPTMVGYQSDLSQMTTYQTASRVMVGVGAAATVAGGVLLVLDLKPPGAGDKAPKTGLGCFGGACGAFAAGRF
jgi:tetratricopeptide (TPR) repeat protein